MEGATSSLQPTMPNTVNDKLTRRPPPPNEISAPLVDALLAGRALLSPLSMCSMPSAARAPATASAARVSAGIRPSLMWRRAARQKSGASAAAASRTARARRVERVYGCLSLSPCGPHDPFNDSGTLAVNVGASVVDLGPIGRMQGSVWGRRSKMRISESVRGRQGLDPCRRIV